MSNLEKYNSFIDKLVSNNIDYYLISYSDEFLNEITPKEKNIIYKLTNFKGENSYLLLNKKKSYLFVDGRFTIEAKNCIKNKNIKIITIDTYKNIYDLIKDIVKSDKLYLDYKYFSIDFVEKLKDKILIENADKIQDDLYLVDNKRYDSFLLKNSYKEYCFEKVRSSLLETTKDENFYYVSINSEEISYFTNLRIDPTKQNNNELSSILFNGYIIINNKMSYIYTDINIDKSSLSFLEKNKVLVNKLNLFYEDINKLQENKNNHIYIDKTINTYSLYDKIEKTIFIDSAIKRLYSIKTDKEIKNIVYANIIDGISMLYVHKLIEDLNFEEIKITEYDFKKLVDGIRNTTEKKLKLKKSYLMPSFNTIVGFKENSSICHYEPSEDSSKQIKYNSILLIDSGAHYLYGTTDVTRTYSLYKNKVPNEIKYDYTMVLKSLLNTMNQKFIYGTHGAEIDFLSRSYLYNEYTNYNHGTGHGIGYASNVHEGLNRLSRIKNINKDNVLNINNVQSIEPGIYKENKYGIRLENDTVVKKLKDNDYGEFLGFESLTLVPFDLNLLDKSLLSKNEIKYLNDYHKLVYDTLNKYLDKDMKKFLKKLTKNI